MTKNTAFYFQFEAYCSNKADPTICLIYQISLFILRPTNRQVRHKAFFKVSLDTGPQPTRVWQNPKIPSAPSAFPQWGRLRHQETKQQTIGKTNINLKNTDKNTFISKESSEGTFQ